MRKLLREFILHFLAFRAALPQGKDSVRDHTSEEDQSVQPAEIFIERKPERQQGYGQHDRRVLADELFGDDDRRDDGCQPEDEEDIEDVRAEYVAEGQVTLTGCSRPQRHGNFGGGCADGNDGQADGKR